MTSHLQLSDYPSMLPLKKELFWSPFLWGYMRVEEQALLLEGIFKNYNHAMYMLCNFCICSVILVCGAGPIGLVSLLVARSMGAAKIIVSGTLFMAIVL